MKDDFLSQILGSRERAQLLRVFLFNPAEMLTSQQAAKRAGISTRTATKEIRVLEKMGIIKKGRMMSITLNNGSKRIVHGHSRIPTWIADQEFKQLRAVSSFVHEVSPVRYENIVGALRKGGRMAAVILSGTFMGDPSRPADLLVAADSLNERRLDKAIRDLEPTFGREIRYAAFSTPEFRYRLTIQDRLIRDTLDFPHLVLLDKTRLL